MVSPIAFANKLYHAPNPLNHFLIIKMLEGSRKAGHQPDTRQPITLSILHRLTAALPAAFHDPFITSLLKAMFLTAFHAFLRVGEFTVRSQWDDASHTLQAADCAVNFTSGRPTSVSLTLTTSKHNQSRPFHITIPANHSPNCPVIALHTYLQLARPRGGPLFQFQDGRPVTRHYFRAQLYKGLKAAGFDTSLYKSHSFRIGAATEAVTSLGLPDHEIQRLGRWNSNAFKTYIRTPQFTSVPR